MLRRHLVYIFFTVLLFHCGLASSQNLSLNFRVDYSHVVEDLPGYSTRLVPIEEGLKEVSEPTKRGDSKIFTDPEVAERKRIYQLAVNYFLKALEELRPAWAADSALRMEIAIELLEALDLHTFLPYYPAYAERLLYLNRIFEAAHALEKGFRIEKDAQIRYLAGDYRPKEFFLEAAISESHLRLKKTALAFSLSQGFSYAVNGNENAFTYKDIWKPLSLSSTQLLETHSLLGNTKGAYALYDGFISDFFNYKLSWFDMDGTNGYALREAVCASAANALARLGKDKRVDKAFRCALQNQWLRALYEAKDSGVPAVIRGNAEMHRLLIGAYLDYLSRTSQFQDKLVARQAISYLIESKGLYLRYQKSRSEYVTAQTGREAVELRDSMMSLATSATQLPTKGRPVIDAYSVWLANEGSVYQSVHKQMVENSLTGVFINGGKSLEQIQSRLRNEAVIGYFVYAGVNKSYSGPGSRRLLRYLVWDKGVELRDIGSLRDVETLIYSTRRGEKSSSIALSEKLLGQMPAAVTAVKKWTIDPDGALHLLPFEALPLTGGQQVLDRYVTRYTTDLTSLGARPEKRMNPTNTAVILADPSYPELTDWVGEKQAGFADTPTTRGASLKDVRLAPLPETADEAVRIATSLKKMGVTSDIRLRDKATVDGLSFTSAPRFLHIAAHGLFLIPTPGKSDGDDANVALTLPELQSVVVLSKGAEGSLLTGLRLSQLPLQGTELVVLSACDTGNGLAEAGEGMAGLRRAVETAGARASITSLWPVPSEATKDLMTLFYSNLASGQPKAEALRAAKLSVRATNPDPRAWAGFIFAGVD